jgi:NAD(P)-dependent dehydrogenase (short-subunit alcohol dehydrogenase family)
MPRTNDRNGRVIGAIPAGARPEEIANLNVFAVSDAASYINDAELAADNAMDKPEAVLKP